MTILVHVTKVVILCSEKPRAAVSHIAQKMLVQINESHRHCAYFSTFIILDTHITANELDTQRPTDNCDLQAKKTQLTLISV